MDSPVSLIRYGLAFGIPGLILIARSQSYTRETGPYYMKYDKYQTTLNWEWGVHMDSMYVQRCSILKDQI